MIKSNVRHCEIPKGLSDCGSIAHHSLSRLRAFLEREASPAVSILSVSLRNVRRCGATFVGIVARIHARLSQTGGRIRLRDVQDDVKSVLEACRMDHLIDKRKLDRHVLSRSQRMIQDTERFLNRD